MSVGGRTQASTEAVDGATAGRPTAPGSKHRPPSLIAVIAAQVIPAGNASSTRSERTVWSLPVAVVPWLAMSTRKVTRSPCRTGTPSTFGTVGGCRLTVHRRDTLAQLDSRGRCHQEVDPVAQRGRAPRAVLGPGLHQVADDVGGRSRGRGPDDRAEPDHEHQPGPDEPRSPLERSQRPRRVCGAGRAGRLVEGDLAGGDGVPRAGRLRAGLVADTVGKEVGDDRVAGLVHRREVHPQLEADPVTLVERRPADRGRRVDVDGGRAVHRHRALTDLLVDAGALGGLRRRRRVVHRHVRARVRRAGVRRARGSYRRARRCW